MSDYSWVTLATNDTYSLGALVLARSLRRVSTNHNLTVMVTPGVSAAMRAQLASVFNVLEEVNILDSKDEKNLALLTRPELGITFTKLHCWRLTQFSKCVFLDADVMVLKNCDELFDREELSAAPDVGWPDCFNSGVFVYRPSIETYNALINFALSQGSFDGGDQGLLNQFFSDWATKDISRHLPFIYNMCSSATYSYLPAFKQFGQNVKIVHFIGTAKPWLQYLDSESRHVKPSPGSEHLQGFLQLWWDIFCNDVHSTLSSEMAGLAGALSQLTLGVARSPEQIALEEHLRKQAWEHGNIDYMNRDSFENIWRKICETLAEAPSDPLPEQRESTSQVSNVVVENISKEVKPGDDISLSESNTISVSSPHLQYTAASSPKSESQSDDATGVRSVPYLETSSGVQADQSSLVTHANDVSVPVTTSDLSTPECQDSSFNQKLVLQQGDTIPSSAIDICTESSPEVVQIASLQDPKLQLLATHQESNQATQIEEKDEIKTEQTVSQPPQDFSKSSGTVDALDSDTTAKSIPDIPHKQASVVSGGSKEPEVSIAHTTEETTVDSQLPSNVVQTQSAPQAYSAEVLGNAGELHTDFSEKTDSAVDLKSNIDSANQPESCPSSTSPSSEPLVDTSKVSVTAPTPPTSPTDNSTLIPPAPLATDALSVEPSILPTPPVGSEPGGVVPMSDPVPVTTVGSESPSTKADQSPDLILASADHSTSPSAAAYQSANPICASPDASGTPSLSVAQCPQPISSDPPSSSSPSESHDTSENTSQAVETKAPIPPKRRHKPSQNPDQSGSKSGKTPTKSPKGKK
ncbi:hypothetical protein R5R35_005240 [Gryllus longicercus]|uniref:glycogenin glucosyltransferase n=1 Tax=Gryllus longicercus TaxID=2509291 RepID=A0AAN9VU80_9ORTH